MRVFFKKMGIEKLRFKPAYNPYTEVSSNVLASPSLYMTAAHLLP
jgi:phenylalanyl-tRNA synthetase alpha chain